MSRELLISVIPGETCAALVEDGALIDLFVARRGRGSRVGDVHLGRVERVAPAMSAAFVEIGIKRAGFLKIAPGGDMPREGEYLLVQIAKDAAGGKSVQLTRRIALPGRLLVMTPGDRRCGVSRRIADPAEQERLLAVIDALSSPGEGFVARTAAEGADAAMLAADAEHLRARWRDVEAGNRPGKPRLLLRELDPLCRVLRDHADPRVDAIVLDDAEAYAEAAGFCRRQVPDLVDRLELHRGPEPLFAVRGIDDAVAQAFEPRCPLPSGGWIAIAETEALTAIDVNTGALTGGSAPGEAALRTNLEAAAEIARQLRVRDIAGLVVVDFIRLEDDEAEASLIREFTEALAEDPARPRLYGRTPAGLVEITRRRQREPLSRLLGVRCAQCGGAGWHRAPETVATDIMRALKREARHAPPGAITVLAHASVVAALEGAFREPFEALLPSLGRAVELRADPSCLPEAFDLLVGGARTERTEAAHA